MGRPSFYSFLAGRGTEQRFLAILHLPRLPVLHLTPELESRADGSVCLSYMTGCGPAQEDGRTFQVAFEPSVSSTEPDMRESVSACLVPAAHSWSDVYFTRSGSRTCPCSPGAGISKFFQGHGMLDGSSSWPPHTETWHCAEGSFSKSIFCGHNILIETMT